MFKLKDLSEFGKRSIVMIRQPVRAHPKALKECSQPPGAILHNQ